MRPPAVAPHTWISLHAHLLAVQQERDRFHAERDRRYTEVAIEREKALKIKEVADLTALQLAREIQVYKDEKANELRSQIERERGNYATRADLVALGEKVDATIKPLIEFVARARGGSVVWGQLAIGVGLLMTAIALFLKL